MTEIPPASLAQIVKGKAGGFVLIEDDVCSIAKQLQEIDSSLRLRYSVTGGYFVVYQLLDNGDEHLVTTAAELDARLLGKVRRLASPDYDLAAELDRVDAAAQSAHDHRFSEAVGEVGQQLHHAIRRDLNLNQNHISVPKGIDDGQS